MSDSLSEAVEENGFSSDTEFFELVAKVNLTAPGALKLFKEWQNTDGTKAGLLAAFPNLTEV